jgi:hypothetical protein
MGALPGAGQWVQLRIPVDLVGLEGKTVTGMGVRALWRSSYMGRLWSDKRSDNRNACGIDCAH